MKSNDLVSIDRKIACDRTGATCQNCIQSKRPCQPYRIRLSWPRVNDSKRALLSHSRALSGSRRIYTHVRFINMSSKDIEIHRHLGELNRYRGQKQNDLRKSIPMLSNIQLAHHIGTYVLVPALSLSHYPGFQCGEEELVSYCELSVVAQQMMH